MTLPSAISVENLSHRYGDRVALNDVSLSVAAGEIFGLLGPNGSGKTTLFRVLCTLLPIQQGRASLAGFDLSSSAAQVRLAIGITFQSPSLDDRLTVYENLKHQSRLYGLPTASIRSRIAELLERVGMSDRSNEIVSNLSGGMKRRVEIAKGLLHSPALLLLDEPSTGLDPGARHDLWKYLRNLREQQNVTILVTTHLMDEAELCDRLAILNRGQVVALDTPDALRSALGGDCITIAGTDPKSLSEKIEQRFALEVRQVGDSLRIERTRGHELIRDLMEAFPEEIESISLGKPTLEDVFIHQTGHRFWEEERA
ncbi:MAG TPA: ATP-binding cassette domain-containing protein [Planctomycetaceae bacterium]|nr:ATP-binding cassette domain-containing protein [Planctomycetaceae bacterium]